MRSSLTIYRRTSLLQDSTSIRTTSFKSFLLVIPNAKMPLQRYYVDPYQVVAPHPYQPQLPPAPLANHHPPYHQVSPAPHYLKGKDIRLQARDAGVQNSFVCNEYYPGRSTYQPIPAPIAYPGQLFYRPAPTPTCHHQNGMKSAVPDVLIPGKRKAPDNKLQREPLPQPAVDIVPQEARVGKEMSSKHMPLTEVYELDASDNQVPRVGMKDYVSPIGTSPTKSSRSPSKRSSIVQEFGHMANMILSEPPRASVEPVTHAVEDYSYLSCLITPGSLLAAPGSLPSSASLTPPSLTSSPALSTADTLAPPSPTTPPLAPVTLPLITITSPVTPSPMCPKPRAYQPLIECEAYTEDGHCNSGTYYSPSSAHGEHRIEDEEQETLQVVNPNLPGWTY